jgi:hypothetical protein
MIQILEDYDIFMDILSSLEDKINYIEFSLTNRLKNTISLYSNKLDSEFNINSELRSCISSLEIKIKNRDDDIYSLTNQLKTIAIIKPIIFNNSISKLFQDKLEIEFEKNNKLKAEIVSLEMKLKQRDDEIYSYKYVNNNK